MKKTDTVLSSIFSSNLSSINEVETGKKLDSASFKEEIIKRIDFFTKTYSLGPGHSVVLIHNNTIEFFIDFLALYFLKVTIIPLDDDLRLQDLERVTSFSNANLVIDSNGPRFISQALQTDLIDISLILFTSGTTGSPKGVLISERALNRKFQILHKYIPTLEMENTLCFLPTFFGHGLICNSLFALFYGKNFYIAKKLTVEFASEFDSFIKEKNINFFSSVPSHWELILNFSGSNFGPHLKRVHCASAPLKTEKIERIFKWLGNVPFFDVYGATEMLGWFACRKVSLSLSSSDSTFTDFWDIKTSYSSDNELLVKSDFMFDGYWRINQPLSDGFFNTGDIFKNNQLVGRSKNFINKNGIKISTDEINTLFLKSGFLLDAASFPIEDDFKGEDIGLFIVIKKEFNLNDFEKYCIEDISQFLYPSKIIPIDKIPVNSRNKESLTLLQRTYKELYDK